MFNFLPLLLVVLAILIAAVIVAQKAAPLGTHPYRWGLFLGITTAAQSVLLMPPLASALAGGKFTVALIVCLWVLSGTAAAVGLIKRRRAGVLLALAFYVQLALWPAVFMTRENIPQEHQRSFATPVAILTATNYFYFKKRWAVLT